METHVEIRPERQPSSEDLPNNAGALRPEKIARANTDKYNVRQYNLSEKFLNSVMQLDPMKSYMAIASTWVIISALVLGMRYLFTTPYGWYFYVPAIFLIAGRMGAFLQLVHEASHGLLANSKIANHRIGQYFCALPIGLTVDGYGSGHIKHHSYTGTDDDPKSDTEKYRVADVRDPMLYVHLLKDLSGITALSTFFAYGNNEEEVAKKSERSGSVIFSFLTLCFVQLLILATLFQFQILEYILLWLIPAMSPHMFLMRIRGIGEHGLPRQLGKVVENSGVGTLYTRSFLTPTRSYSFFLMPWIEKALIGSMKVYFHHEHHLLPRVPFYNLEKVHHEIKDQVMKNNPEIYVRGYFTAFLRSILRRA